MNKYLVYSLILSTFLLTACNSASPSTSSSTTTSNTPGSVSMVSLTEEEQYPDLNTEINPSNNSPQDKSTNLPSITINSNDISKIDTGKDLNTDSSQSEGGDFSLYFIALNDKGASGQKIGCDDSVVPVQQTSKNGGEKNTQQLLTEAYQLLLSIKDKSYGESGFTNILAKSNLQLESLEIQGTKAIVKLTGVLNSEGICDDPRIKAQLEQTALQFPDLKTVEIYINGKSLDQWLSQKG